MNCPTCGKKVLGLACESCTNARAYEAIRQAQRHYLRDARLDQIRFFAVRRAAHGAGPQPWHLALFGDRTHTFCGEEFLRPGYMNRTHLSWRYTQERQKEICDKCLGQVRKLEEQQDYLEMQQLRDALREES